MMKALFVLFLLAARLGAATVILTDGTVVSDTGFESEASLLPDGSVNVDLIEEEACISVQGSLESVFLSFGGFDFEGELSPDGNCGFFEEPVTFKSFGGRAEVPMPFPATEFISIYAHRIPEPSAALLIGLASVVFWFSRRARWAVVSVGMAVMVMPADAQFDIDLNRYRSALVKAMPENGSKARADWMKKIDLSGVSLGSRKITLIHNKYTRVQRFGIAAKHYSSSWKIGRLVPFRDRAGGLHRLRIAAVGHVDRTDLTVVMFDRDIPGKLARYGIVTGRGVTNTTAMIHINKRDQVYIGCTAVVMFGNRRVGDFRPHNFATWWPRAKIVTQGGRGPFRDDPVFAGRGGYNPVVGDSGSPVLLISGGRRGRFYSSIYMTFTTPGSGANVQRGANLCSTEVPCYFWGEVVALSKRAG